MEKIGYKQAMAIKTARQAGFYLGTGRAAQIVRNSRHSETLSYLPGAIRQRVMELMINLAESIESEEIQ